MTPALQKARENEHVTLPIAAAALTTVLAGVLTRVGVPVSPEEQGALTTLFVAGASLLAHRRM